MKTENKVPRYKELNGMRTQGEWQANTQDRWPFTTYIETEDYCIMSASMAHYSTGDNSIEDCLKRDPVKNGQVLADVAYTALAVNHLEELAEALESIINCAFTNSANTVEIGKAELRKAKEALNRIS